MTKLPFLPAARSQPAQATVVYSASYSHVEIAVEGDNAQPLVIAVDPQGSTSEFVDQIQVDFSEGVDQSTLGSSTVRLVDSGGQDVGFETEISDDLETLLLSLDSAVDASLDSYQLIIQPDLGIRQATFLMGLGRGIRRAQPMRVFLVQL